ncbi:DAZ-associated protein 2 isoform X2 [Vidua chalybeata]|uniref:DAZ-associated protein 2 isoform X2 n=1 Tax=Vidua chalybeata TaxID=81927 RepID=UPI0023A8C922|nr:DAZ-associated protein 2 isoform X2 [Vidua chalybeata]
MPWGGPGRGSDGAGGGARGRCLFPAVPRPCLPALLTRFPPPGPFPGQALLPGPAPPGYPQTLPLLPPYLDPAAAYPELYRLSLVPLGAAGIPAVSPAFPGASLYLPLAPPPPLGALGSPVAYFPLGQVYPPGPTVLLDGGFDTAARLGTGGTTSIPPPPAGCPPGAPPVPVPPGAAVLLPPRKGGFLGGAGGGFSLW